MEKAHTKIKVKIQALEKEKKKALLNAKRQELAMDAARYTGRFVRVRPSFWIQAAKDYSREIESLSKTLKKLKKQSKTHL